MLYVRRDTSVSGYYLVIDPDSKEDLLTALNNYFKNSHVVEVRLHPKDSGISIWIAGYVWKDEKIEEVVFDVHVPNIGKYSKIKLEEVVSLAERIHNLNYML